MTIICAPASTAPLVSWRIAALGALIEVTTMAVALSIGVLPGSRGANDERDGDLTLVRRGPPKRRSPAPRPGFPRLPSVSPISLASSTCPKRGGCRASRARAQLKAGRGSKVTIPEWGAASKRPKKLPICNYAPQALGTKIPSDGFSLPITVPPQTEPRKGPASPVGAFSFLGAKAPSLDSSMKRLFGEAIERLWRSRHDGRNHVCSVPESVAANTIVPARSGRADQVPASTVQIPFYRSAARDPGQPNGVIPRRRSSPLFPAIV